MRREHLKYLVCPKCSDQVALSMIQRVENDSVAEGTLECVGCEDRYPIVRHVPRFVDAGNYAASFGFQWNRHTRTQLDSYSGSDISARRFREETLWSLALPAEIILEVGSGAGRFTEHAAATGAMVVSIDASTAVDVNYAANGQRDNVLIVQGDVYSLPVREESCDKVFCFGMLQHTPDPDTAFAKLARCVTPGGNLAIDVYALRWWTYLASLKYWVRAITRRLEPGVLHEACVRYVRFMWPLVGVIRRFPGGRFLSRIALIADYRGVYELPDIVLQEWAILDTFDMLSPFYDRPQRIVKVRRWFSGAGFQDVHVRYARNGIEGRGRKPMS